MQFVTSLPRRGMPSRFFPLAATALAVFSVMPRPAAAELAQSEWVRLGDHGRLGYKQTPAGDRIMDFSFAGYRGGGVAFPDVPVKITVEPSGGEDDTAVIQAAIEKVAALPLENGHRGAVLLAAGIFNCPQTISISAHGVVLRGSGSGLSGGKVTTLKLTGRPHPAIVVRAGGAGARGREEETPAGPRSQITDAYVPSGATSFAVADASTFKVGDTVLIERPVTAPWVKLMAMDDLTRNDRPQTWMREGTTTTAERRITAIAGQRLTVDVPLSDSFDAKYLNPPGTAVIKITPPARVTEVGVEHLHIESPLQEISHSQPHFTALRMNGEDCWARDLAIDETMNSTSIGGQRITFERVAVRRKARHQGASKPAEFAPNGHQVLLDRCSVAGDNVWFIATGGGVSGPIVILNCTFLGNGRSEAHQRWSTGMLYDNCRAPDGGFEMRNRGSMGSGHGWAMGWGVLWNCEARDLLVQNPPGALNWVIGSKGHLSRAPRPFGSGPALAGGVEDSNGNPVEPRSLYLAQLAERLGPPALKAIGYASTDPSSAEQQAPVTPLNEAGQGPPETSAATLGQNLALDRPVLTTNHRAGDRAFAGWQALDEDDGTAWRTDDGKDGATLELDTEGALEVNAVELREAADAVGHVKSYRVEGFVNSAWKLLSEGTTIGKAKVDRFPTTTVWKMRLIIARAEPNAAIAKLGIYCAKP